MTDATTGPDANRGRTPGNDDNRRRTVTPTPPEGETPRSGEGGGLTGRGYARGEGAEGRTVAPTPAEGETPGSGEGGGRTGHGYVEGAGGTAGRDAGVDEDRAVVDEDRAEGRTVAPTPSEATDSGTKAPGRDDRRGGTTVVGASGAAGAGARTATTSGSTGAPGRTDTTPGNGAAGPRLFPHDESDKLQLRLRHAVAGFVDGPREAVVEADEVVEEIAGRFVEAVTRRRRTLRMSWQDGDEDERNAKGSHPDTEQLRLALRDYRELAERLLQG